MSVYTDTVFSVNAGYTVADIPPPSMLGDYASMEFCANLKRLRQAKGWNQDALADRLGVAQPTVQRWENGKREPKFDDIERIASALEVSVSDLFKDDNTEVPAISPFPNEEALARLLDALLPLAPKGRQTAQSLRVLSVALKHGLELLGPATGTPPSDEALAVAARGAVSRLRDLLQ